MSQMLLHVGDCGALSPVLAVPSVSVEEDEVNDFRLLVFLLHAEYSLNRGAFSAHLAGIFLGDPDRSDRLGGDLPARLLCPPFDRQRNSLTIQHLENRGSDSLRVMKLICLRLEKQVCDPTIFVTFVTNIGAD